MEKAQWKIDQEADLESVKRVAARLEEALAVLALKEVTNEQ